MHIAGVGCGRALLDRSRSTKQIRLSHLPEWKDSCLDAQSIQDLSAEPTDKIADICDNEDTCPPVSGQKATYTFGSGSSAQEALRS